MSLRLKYLGMFFLPCNRRRPPIALACRFHPLLSISKSCIAASMILLPRISGVLGPNLQNTTIGLPPQVVPRCISLVYKFIEADVDLFDVSRPRIILHEKCTF